MKVSLFSKLGCWLACLTRVWAQEPAPTIFDGQDGLQPPLTLRSSTLEKVSQIKPGYPIWDAIENWGNVKTGRVIFIRRSRFRSRQEAIDNIRSSINPGANLFRLVARGKWDTEPRLGQRSVTVQAPGAGLDAVMFVLDKQFIFLEVRHRPAQNTKSLTYLLRIGKSLEASIRARHESGEDEP